MINKALSDAFYENMRTQVKKRLSKKRFAHSESVSQMAIDLAKTYGSEWKKARLAGILHDWDKDIDDVSIVKRAVELKVETLPYVMETMPRLLHGLTAATALKKEYPEIPEDVLCAIAHHTSACVDMSDLDMIVYVADVIEPLRPYPAGEALRNEIGTISLEDLFLKTFKQVFSHLLEKNYRIHPASIEVWNYYIVRARKRT